MNKTKAVIRTYEYLLEGYHIEMVQYDVVSCTYDGVDTYHIKLKGTGGGTIYIEVVDDGTKEMFFTSITLG